MVDRSFYRHELAFAHEQTGAAIKELLVLKARWPSPFAPGDSVVHKGVTHTILGVYFTPGRVQYRLSDGSNVDSKDVTAAVVPMPPTGTRCSVCGKPQFQTTSGVTCPDGHGGAEGTT